MGYRGLGKLEKVVEDMKSGEHDRKEEKKSVMEDKVRVSTLPSPKKQRVLAGERSTFVINLLAQFKTEDEILSLLKDVHQVQVVKQTITNFKKNHKREVAEARQKFLAQVNDIPIAIEKVRLQRDEELYQLSQKLDENKDKIAYGLKCLEEARAELKGSNSTLTFNQYNQNNMFSDAQLLQKIKETEEKIVLLNRRTKDGIYAAQAEKE